MVSLTNGDLASVMRFRTATWSSRSTAVMPRKGGTTGKMKRTNGPQQPHGRARTRLTDAEKKFFSECRFRAWNNVLVIVLFDAGYDVVVRNTAKRRRWDVQSTFQIVKVSKGGNVVYDRANSDGETSKDKTNAAFNSVVEILKDAPITTASGSVEVVDRGVKRARGDIARKRRAVEIVVRTGDPALVTRIDDKSVLYVGYAAWDILAGALGEFKKKDRVRLAHEDDTVTVSPDDAADGVCRKAVCFGVSKLLDHTARNMIQYTKLVLDCKLRYREIPPSLSSGLGHVPISDDDSGGTLSGVHESGGGVPSERTVDNACADVFSSLPLDYTYHLPAMEGFITGAQQRPLESHTTL